MKIRQGIISTLIEILNHLHGMLFPEERTSIIIDRKGVSESPLAFAVDETGRDYFIISPRKLYSVLQKFAREGLLEKENEAVFVPEEILVAIVCHELRHKAVHRGLVRPFDYESINQLFSILYPPENAQRYIQAFEEFARARNDPLEGDAHMIEIIAFDQAHHIEDLKELIPILLLSPE